MPESLHSCYKLNVIHLEKKTEWHVVSLPKGGIFICYVDLVLFLMRPLLFWTPSHFKGWWGTYSEKVTLLSTLLCRKVGLYHLTLYCRRHREMTWHRTETTPRYGFDAAFTSRHGWFTTSHRQLATVISFAYYCRSSSKAVWEYSGHSLHKLKQTMQSRWFAAYFSR